MRDMPRRGMAQSHRPRRHHLLPPVLRQWPGLRGAPDAPRQPLRACRQCCAGLAVSAARRWVSREETTAQLEAMRVRAEQMYALQVVRIPEVACTSAGRQRPRGPSPQVYRTPLGVFRRPIAVAGAWLSKLAAASVGPADGPRAHQEAAPKPLFDSGEN